MKQEHITIDLHFSICHMFLINGNIGKNISGRELLLTFDDDSILVKDARMVYLIEYLCNYNINYKGLVI